MVKLILSLALPTSLLSCLVSAEPRVLSMDYRRESHSAIGKRDPVNVPLQNHKNLYSVQVGIGTPPQNTSLQIDTGSTVTFALAPGACVDGNQCQPSFDSSKSSTYNLVSKGKFTDTFLGGAPIHGDFISDNFQVGGASITNLSLGLGIDKADTTQGLMGLGRNGSQVPSILSSMVDQGLINANAFSLYLDDIDTQTGKILFGGYDTGKFEGDLTFLNTQPNLGGGGSQSSGNIAWTSFALTNANSTTLLSPKDFPINAGLDSGTSNILLPADVLQEVYNYFDAVPDKTNGQIVSCGIAGQQGSLDFGFGDVTYIAVPFAEVLQAATDSNGNQIKMPDGSPACTLGMSPSTDNIQFILGDSFLRSAYVVYDLDENQIGIAQTIFKSNNTNIQEIGSPKNGTPIATQASTASPETITASRTPTSASSFTFNSYSGDFGVVTGVTTSLPLPSATGLSDASTTSSSPSATSSSAASALALPPPSGGLLLTSTSLVVLMTSIVFVMFLL